MKNKRAIAFIIDMLIISLLTTCLSSIERFNPFLNKYDDVRSNYSKVADDAYNTYLKDQDAEKFVGTLSDYMYKIEKYSVVTNSMYIVIFILYFGVFQYVTGGETVGKRIFKLKVVNLDDSDVPVGKMCLRCLINGNSLYYGFNLILVIRILLMFSVSKATFISLYTPLIILTSVIDFAFLLIYIIRKDNRGLNDLIFKTKVIER